MSKRLYKSYIFSTLYIYNNGRVLPGDILTTVFRVPYYTARTTLLLNILFSIFAAAAMSCLARM